MNKLLTGKTILLVEDEMLILMLAEDYLHQLGCTSILVAGTTRQALDAIAAHDIDAAMVDMNLHGEISDTVADARSDKGHLNAPAESAEFDVTVSESTW